MGTTLNKKTYAKLIDENIVEMEKHMPDSLERRHAIDVLRWSINALYEREIESKKFVDWICTNGYSSCTNKLMPFANYSHSGKWQYSIDELYELFKAAGCSAKNNGA